MARKSESSPVTFERALGLLFGVARKADIPKPKHWTPWKQPKPPLAIDKWISKLSRAGRGVKLLAREKFDGRQSPFGPVHCPYYTARVYLLRAIGSAQSVHDNERGLDLSKSHNLEFKTELDSTVLRLERLLGLDNSAPTDNRLAWPRNLVLSIVDRQTGMIDLDDEAARAAELRKAVDRLKTANRCPPLARASRLSSTAI